MTINSLNIVVPLKNEEKSAKILIETLKPIIKKIEKKTVVTLINDHSSDETLKILKELEQKFDFIRVYNNENSTGFGNALKFGINNNKEDALIIFMGDCSDNPSDILEYVKSRILEDQGDMDKSQYFKQKYNDGVMKTPTRKSGVRVLLVPNL